MTVVPPKADDDGGARGGSGEMVELEEEGEGFIGGWRTGVQ